MSYTVTADNVTVVLGGTVILKNVNLKINEGETVVFIGPSGSGKTVLLKTLAGVYAPSTGKVLLEGENWQQLDNEGKHKLARKLGMLFQQGALFDEMSTLENVEFPIREHYPEKADDEVHALAKDLLESVNLGDSLKKIPSELSGGMQRRLGVARALALNPEVIFYDDPVAGQDPIQADTVRKLIQKFQKANNSTVILSTSSMRFAYKVADRIFMVIDQEVIETGTPEETQNFSDARVQQFIKGEVKGPISVS